MTTSRLAPLPSSAHADYPAHLTVPPSLVLSWREEQRARAAQQDADLNAAPQSADVTVDAAGVGVSDEQHAMNDSGAAAASHRKSHGEECSERGAV